MSTRPWSIGLAVAIAAHGLIAALLIATHTLLPPPKPAGAAILLDLPPQAPPAPTKAPEPQQKPKPVVKRLKPAAAKPVSHQAVAQPQAVSMPGPVPSPVEAAEPVPASAHQTALAPDPQAVSSWQSRLLAHLERHKRFPSLAQSRRLRGTVLVAFSLDRSGMVLAQAVNISSGHPSLDAAALDMLTRAQPLPAPPPEIAGAVLQLTVPVRFSLN